MGRSTVITQSNTITVTDYIKIVEKYITWTKTREECMACDKDVPDNHHRYAGTNRLASCRAVGTVSGFLRHLCSELSQICE